MSRIDLHAMMQCRYPLKACLNGNQGATPARFWGATHGVPSAQWVAGEGHSLVACV